MENSSLSFALLLLLLNISITLCLSSSILDFNTDKHSLVSFKNNIKSDHYASLTTNWSDATSACNWIGVSCGTKHRRVVALNLSGYGLAGTLAPHLGNLTFLRYLDLSFNHFTGFFPSELSKLRRLRMINVGSNSFTGELPAWLGSLPQLEKLILHTNNFSGEIPAEIGNLSRLEILNIPSASLIGNIPFSIFNISSLKFLSLQQNSLSGSIPTLHNLPQLEELYLNDNKLTGELPQEFGTLQFLHSFSVCTNSLFGSIPFSIFNISTLKMLSLAVNNFSGSLPSDMGLSLFNLEWFQLSSNRLYGSIPSSIINASRLRTLSMDDNSFSGLIPKFGNLRLLQTLTIAGNNLSGVESPTQELDFLSSLTNCQNLDMVSISDNPLNGILPESIGNFSKSLHQFFAINNNISGVIPPEIGNLSNLLSLYLGGNQMTGLIPPTIGRLKKLQRLYLNDNQFVGSIPNDLCQLKSLGELFLEGNKLIGPIPECLGDVKNLRAVNLDSNQLNSTIPLKLWTLTDLQYLSLSSNYFTGQLSSQLENLKVINYLKMSFNQFSGPIPDTIGSCQSLEFLYLSNNLFSGSIPRSLENVSGLRTLDLSYNNLSGCIPKSLENLSILLSFNVSNNGLEGEIPNEGPFSNFDAQSFAHNRALCGPKRFQVPSCSENKTLARSMKYIVPSLVLVVIVVIVVFVLVRRSKQKKVQLFTSDSRFVQWRRISYMELERGTNWFSETNLLGRGSFGTVFKATLFDGLKVAVKVFNLDLEGAARSFDTEAEILSNIRHRNLVRVIGCCTNKEFRALILTYMSSGSLEKWLYSHIYCLNLMQRLNITIDVALALEYLHHGYTLPVVHCDIKPSNVLLDEDMVAHLGDFGISKVFDGGKTVIQTQTLATIGYAAPEFGMEGNVSTNGDVYSFGILVLEIFTGKRPTDDMFSGDMSLKEWVSEALQENAATKIVASTLLSREDQHFSTKDQGVSSIFNLAMKCLAVLPDERINMIEVVATLQKIKDTLVASI